MDAESSPFIDGEKPPANPIKILLQKGVAMSMSTFCLKPLALFLVILAIITCSDANAEMNAPMKSTGQMIYVPIYSHIYTGDKEFPFLLAATLSIRNTDRSNPITITTVAYYDSKGNLLVNYLAAPLVLDKLSSTRFVIKESDKTGGSGASFIVQWESDAKVYPPLVESIMIGTRASQGLSFSSRGKVLEERTAAGKQP